MFLPFQRQHQDPSYKLKDMSAPVLAGRTLIVLTHILENSALLRKLVMLVNNMYSLRRKKMQNPPAMLPTAHHKYLQAERQKQAEQQNCDLKEFYMSPQVRETNGGFCDVKALHQSYQQGRTDPYGIAQAILQEIKNEATRKGSLHAIASYDADRLLAAAEASKQRIKVGEPLSLLDGVPIIIKSDFHVQGLSSSVGTSFLELACDAPEATSVARLRDAGALIIATSQMHEIGIGVTGANVHFGAARNPYDLKRHTGGSSSGTAAAVASGLCPIGVGSDGGGSVRIPASLCGLVGLKTSFGRLSSYGSFPSCNSVCQSGVLATNALDCALAYQVMAGMDERDQTSIHQPEPSLRNFTNIDDLSDLKAGFYPAWFYHSDPELAELCMQFLKTLQSKGLHLQELVVPELEEVRVAHFNTIAPEMHSALKPYLSEHRSKLSYPTRIRLALASQTSSLDYLQAQRIRYRAIKNLEEIFSLVDFLVCPSSAIVAPLIREENMDHDELDNFQMGQLMRFSQLHNLTGVPSISIPAGYTRQGLPVGIQFASRWWAEADLLRMAHAAEQLVTKKLPGTYWKAF
ncbi:MAG: amidase [Oligoflexus sp.]